MKTLHFLKHITVKCQSFFIRFILFACRKDAAPRNGQAEHGKSHFRKQSKVFLVAVVKVNAPPFRIIGGVLLCDGLIDVFHRHAGRRLVILHINIRTVSRHIRDAHTFSIYIPRAFDLVGGNCTAP